MSDPLVRLDGWADFLAALRMGARPGGLDDGRHAFRGGRTADCRLLPLLGRLGPHDEGHERYILDSFKRQAVDRAGRLPDSEIGWMALARHHRLPTRLLDWSMSPMVAAWFGAAGQDGYGLDSGTDFAIWVLGFDEPDFVESSALAGFDPFALERDYVLVSPPHYSSRVTAQRGFFSVHRRPAEPFRSARLGGFVIPGTARQSFLQRLDFLGINHASILPDLDGLGLQLGWYYAHAPR